MSEKVDTGEDKKRGAEVVFRKFVDLYDQKLKKMKKDSPNEYASTLAEWMPSIFYYFDGSFNASFSLYKLEEMLLDVHDSPKKSKAVLDGLYNASLRTIKKSPSKETARYFDYFFKSREGTIYENKAEEIFYVANDAPLAIFNYDGSYQAELAMGIVRKTIKNIDDKMVEHFIHGLYVKTLAVGDFVEMTKFRKTD